MAHKLKAEKVKYSKNEQKLFDLLSSKKQSTTELLKGFYGRKEPFNGRRILIGVLRSLKRKIVANRESFRLESTKRNGPHSMFFWIEAK